VVGAFLCARAEAIASIGPMDERFFLYSEEIDWCLRAHQAGWDVRHLPAMTVTHHAGRRDRGDLMAQLAYSRSLFARKHHGALGALGIRAALAVGHLLRIALRAPQALVRGSARERIGAEARALRVLLGLGQPPLKAEPLTRPPNPSATVLDEAR
jgi:GT2 family glycosyltransferase